MKTESRKSVAKDHLRLIVASLCLVILTSACESVTSATTQNPPAVSGTVMYRNGKIYTVNERQPWAEAMVVKDGVIVYLGTEKGFDAALYPALDKGMQQIDLRGRLVLPGLHDVHAHVLEAGLTVGGSCQVQPQDNIDQLLATTQRCDKTPMGTEWILGFGHALENLLTQGLNPAKALDSVIPDRPAAFMDETSHSVWVNSAALKLAGITKETAMPKGGIIMLDATTGEPNGLLLDAAGELIFDLAIQPTTDVIDLNYDALLWGLQQLRENGITSVTDARVYWRRGFLQAWQRAAQNNKLTARAVVGLWAYPNAADDNQQIAELKAMDSNIPQQRLRVSQIKLYSDGIISNTTAALLEPYQISLFPQSTIGINYFDQQRLTHYISELEKVGFDMHIHAIGERGVREALNAIEAARSSNPAVLARHRLTHLEMVHTDDRPRFKELGVIADFQVAGDFALPENAYWEETYIGQRAYDMFPVRSVFETGAVVTLSSDWDVSSLNPFVGMQHALQLGAQSMPSLAEVIRSYTLNGAYLMRQEDKVGSLEIGKHADFIVVNQNIFSVDIDQIGATKVLLTVVEGEQVYRDRGF